MILPARNIILRVMLWSLGLAAATGIATVFVQGGAFMWRVIGTEIAAAVSCGLMLACMRLIDREKARASGLFGMAAIVVEFCLALLLIWDLPRALGFWQLEERLWLTLVLLAVAALIAMPLLACTHRPGAQWSARVALRVVAVATAFLLISIWYDTPYGFEEHCAETGWAVFATGTILSLCLAGLGTPPARYWRWGGVLFALGALTLWLGGIWIGRGSDLGFATFTGLLAASAATAYAMICLTLPIKETQHWFRGALIAVAAITAALIELWVLADRSLVRAVDTSLLERCIAAAGIVTGCGTLALAVLSSLNRRVDVTPGDEAITDIVVICPRCRKKQSLAIGDAACAACGLRISTRVEEPRCPTCAYLLIGLTSDRCPECGTAIAS